MGDYSLEPPRKDLFLHHTYDAIDPGLDRVLDTGPQGHDGSIVGTVTTGVQGIDGEAVRVVGTADSHVSVNAQPGTLDEITVATWVNFEEIAESASQNAEWRLDLGTAESLYWQYPNDFTGWHFFVGWYDGDSMKIYHGTETDSPTEVASDSSVSGSIENDFLLELDMSFSARIDDTRVYERALDKSEIDDVWEIATTNQHVDRIGELWDNPGIPYIRGKGNARLSGALGQKTSKDLRILDQMREARHINDAAGKQIDAIGGLIGVKRKEGELDGPYRARIKGTAIAARSSGTFEDLIDGLSTILNADPQNITINEGWDDPAVSPADPATAYVYVNQTQLDNADIAETDFSDLADEMVISGHTVVVTKTDDTPFELTEDGGGNDPTKGLTSDSDSRGGTLSQDI